MSGTDIGYGGIRLRACYAKPGTEIAYGAVGVRVGFAICLRARCHATRYWHSVWCYLMRATDIPYAAASLHSLCL
eukprot:3531-Rhodomonas_salina.3